MQLTEVHIENIRSFGEGSQAVTLNFGAAGSLPKWIVVAGRNGSGKSTFLQAIALAIAGPAVSRVLAETFTGWVREGQTSAWAAVRLRVQERYDVFRQGGRRPTFDPWTALQWTLHEEGPEPAVDHKNVGGRWSPTRGPWADNPTGWFLAGYGPFRRLSSAPTEAQRLMMIPGRTSSLASLFREDASLSESVRWLQQVYLRRLEKDRASAEMERLLLALLDDGLLPEGLQVTRVTSEGLWVRTPVGTELPLRSLSDGYRTVATLVLDLIRQLTDCFGTLDADHSRRPVEIRNEGVVLIDEIDVHLHVSWQQRIGFWLREHFPNLQFVITTHSPFVCQAADEGGLVRLPAPGEDRHAEIVTGELFSRVVNGSADDAVLTELFGLETPLSGRAEEARRELAAYEAKVSRGDATQSDFEQLNLLRTRVPQTVSSDVATALHRLSEELG
jgi:energy-coupling factor transporter ATP-binding protein EcfA2